MNLEVGSLSDVGRTRDHNEDYLGMYRPADAEQRRRKGELFLVADGIGGHQSGEVASRMAVEQILQAYSGSSGQDIVANLVQAVEAANANIYTMGQGQDRRWRMGTTLVGALVRDRQVHIVNVGDSRAYLVRGAVVEQVSQDHSLVAEQVRLGLIDSDQAKNQDYRSAITRALGSKPNVQVDTFTRPLQHGDLLVLCTDGLSGLVKDEEIGQAVSSQPPAQAAASLVALANARGGRDNITTIVIKAYERGRQLRPRASGGQAAEPRKKLGWLIGLLAGTALLLAALLAIALFITLGMGKDLPHNPPVIAPIELAGNMPPPGERDDVARILGYADENDLLIKQGLRPDQPWPSIKPKTIYVLLTGQIVRLDAALPCSFTLDMGGQPYYDVRCVPGVSTAPDVRLVKGDQVSVLGTLLDETTRRVEPITIDVNKVKWLGLSSEWKNWYTVLKPGQSLLVYTVVSSYTVLKAGERDLVKDYGFHTGDAIAVYGPWDLTAVKAQWKQDQYAGMSAFDRVFRLDDVKIYKQIP